MIESVSPSSSDGNIQIWWLTYKINLSATCTSVDQIPIVWCHWNSETKRSLRPLKIRTSKISRSPYSIVMLDPFINLKGVSLNELRMQIKNLWGFQTERIVVHAKECLLLWRFSGQTLSFHSVGIHLLPWCHDDCISSSCISQRYHGSYSDIAYFTTNVQHSSQANSQRCFRAPLK